MARNLLRLLNEIIGDITGIELARRLRKSASYVSQMRSGAQIPTAETLTRLAAAFGVPERLPDLLLAALRDQLASLNFPDEADSSLKDLALSSAQNLGVYLPSVRSAAARSTGRTLKDFPESFYPLAVITGDKREDRGSRISAGDLGAYAATPGDTRWMMNLGLRPDVVKHVDKDFVLLGEVELIREFSEVNLLVVGSPASNHLARRINSSAVFRFNYSPDVELAIDKAITEASAFSSVQLAAYREQERNQLGVKMRSLFAGGVFDPTHSAADYVAANYARIAMNTQLDFGVLTFAANPYYVRKCEIENRECDHRYVSIMAAGIHHPATAHALRLLGQECRRKGVFDEHPYGGVIRVHLDLNVPFCRRTMKALCEWEDGADNDRRPSTDQKKVLLEQLEIIERKVERGQLRSLALSKGQAAQCRKLIESL